MQTHDAELLRAAMKLTVAVTAGVAVIAGGYDGGRAALGAVLGGVLVMAFFGLGHVVSSLTARISPTATLVAAMLSYAVKVSALALVLVTYGDATAFSTEAFAAGVLVATLSWLSAEVWRFGRLRIPYVVGPQR